MYFYAAATQGDDRSSRTASAYRRARRHMLQGVVRMSQVPLDVERSILYIIPALFLCASALHFVFRASGRMFAVGLIAPVNESVWEHLKLAFLPTALWWIGYHLWRGRQNEIGADAWFTAAAIGVVTACLLIPMVYYVYREGLGIHSLALDIALLLVAMTAGQCLALHVLRYGLRAPAWVGLAVLVALLLLFAVWTVHPPRRRLFLDTTTGKYGMER